MYEDGHYPYFCRGVIPRPEIDHTDGIGTKGLYHWAERSFKAAVQDALAMNLNDLLMARAVAYKCQNHLVLQEDDSEAILEIIQALCDECKKRRIAVTGGETSIHNTMQGLDLSITVTGFIENHRHNRFEPGDGLVGLWSSGLHSNGLTKARQVCPAGSSDFTIPTRIYYDEVLPFVRFSDISGIQHITGGAFTKLKRQKDVDIHLDQWDVPPIFRMLHAQGVSERDMYQTFNCGVGMILSTPAHRAKELASKLNGAVIGWAEKGTGRVVIRSGLSSTTLEY
jgi:phosphoribosylformylglycinamidine cyclo-ligase